MQTSSTPAGSASWRVTIDFPRDLHLALFVRGALSVSVLPDIGAPTVPTPRIRIEDAVAPAEWLTWWRRLLDQRRYGVQRPIGLASITDPDKMTDLPSVAASLPLIMDDFHSWWAGPPGRDLSGQKFTLVQTHRDEVSPEAEILRQRGRAISITVDVLGLDGECRYAVAKNHVVVSETTRKAKSYVGWLEGQLFGN